VRKTEKFGWAKQYGGLRRMMYRGLERVAARVTFTMAAFNLMRIRNIEMAA
jgi:IS5 family transposase